MKRILHRSIIWGSISLLSLFLLMSCEKDSIDDDLALRVTGTWQQSSRTIGGTLTTKDSTRLVMQINANNICLMCDSTLVAKKARTIIKRSGWSCSGGLLNIAIDLPASWQVTANDNDLSLEKSDFDRNGEIVRTVVAFKRIENFTIE